MHLTHNPASLLGSRFIAFVCFSSEQIKIVHQIRPDWDHNFGLFMKFWS